MNADAVAVNVVVEVPGNMIAAIPYLDLPPPSRPECAQPPRQKAHSQLQVPPSRQPSSLICLMTALMPSENNMRGASRGRKRCSPPRCRWASRHICCLSCLEVPWSTPIYFSHTRSEINPRPSFLLSLLELSIADGLTSFSCLNSRQIGRPVNSAGTENS